MKKILQFSVGLVGLAGAAMIFSHVSGVYDVEPVISMEAPVTTLSVSASMPMVIPLNLGERQISGLALYLAEGQKMIPRVRVRLRDETGRLMARERGQKVVYPQTGPPALQIFFTKDIQQEGNKLQLEVWPRGKATLFLLANQAAQLTPIYSWLYPAPVTSGAKQGALIGVVLGIALWLSYEAERRLSRVQQWLVAAGIILGGAVLAGLPFIYPLGDWGLGDWDYRYSVAQIYQQAIKQFKQLPGWNPYICGGTAAIGDPELSLFTPSFALQLVFGTEKGTSLALVASVGWLGGGMLLLGKRLGLRPVAALTAAIVVMFSSSFWLKIAEGHVTIFWAYIWLPWLGWALLQAYRQEEARSRGGWILVGGIILTQILLQGGIYILSYLGLVFIALVLMAARRWRALTVCLGGGIWLLGLGSFQLLPTLNWMREFPDRAFVPSAAIYNNLGDIFFGRYVQGKWLLSNQVSGWHEYGAYIGYGVVVLAIIGMSYASSRRLVRGLIIGVAAGVILAAVGPFVTPLLEGLPFLPRSNISRLLLIVIMGISLLAGWGMQRLLEKFPRWPVIPLMVAGYVAVDLMSLAYPIAEQTFSVPRVMTAIPPASYPLVHTNENFVIRLAGRDTPRAYAAVQQGYGTDSFCSVLGPVSGVSQTRPGEEAPSYLQIKPAGKVRLTTWSPNKISFIYQAPVTATVVLETNYASGWQASHGKINQEDGRLALSLPTGEQEVTLRYHPPGWQAGVLITSLTMIAGLGQGVYSIKKVRSVEPT